MAKKDLQAAAAGTLEGMRRTPAQRIAQAATEPQTDTKTDTKKKGSENTAPFTIWTKPENVRKWKAYQKAKKATLKTQTDFIVAAVNEYMQKYPATAEEVDAVKAELLKSLEL